MKLPDGFEATSVRQEAQPLKTGGIIQANSLGIIDNSYSAQTIYGNFRLMPCSSTVIEKTSASASQAR
jgi:dUTPase